MPSLGQEPTFNLKKKKKQDHATRHDSDTK